MNDQPPPPATDRASHSARFFTRLHRWRTLLKRGWWIPALALFLALGVQGYLIWRTPASYRSEGWMIVSMKLSIPEGSIYSEEMSYFLGTQRALMESAQNRAGQVVQKERPELLPVPVEVRVDVSPKTSIFLLRATGAQPDYTQAFLQASMNEYINLKKEMRSKTSGDTLQGITEELARLKRDLRIADDELVVFQTSNSVVFLQEQGNSAAAYLNRLNSQLADLQTEYELLSMLSPEQNLERQQRASASPASTASLLESDAEYLKAKQQIQMMKAEQTELGTYLRPKHPKMINLSEDIARRERLLDILRQQNVDGLQSRRKSIELQIENLQRQVKDWETKSLDASMKIAEYQKIRSKATRVQGLYDRLLGTMQTLDVNKQLSPESVAILKPASPALPDRGSITKSLAIAGFLGLAVAGGMLILMDRLDDRMTSYTELVQHFDEPVLGQIPRDREARRGAASLPIKPDDERHPFIESYRNLRSSIHYLSLENPSQRPKILLVTSSIPGDGKSITAANFAITLAQAGNRVLLVDADVRKGAQHQRFELQASPGLSEALLGERPWRDSVRATPVANLSLLPRGAPTTHSSELFLKPITRTFLDEAKAEFDCVILDSPPVMAADDVTSLAPHAEGVIFVIRAQQTSARVARAALELLYQRGVNVLGLVFNAVDTKSGDHYYYAYKDYYAAYPKS